MKKLWLLMSMVLVCLTACSEGKENEEYVDDILESVEGSDNAVSGNFGISNEWNGENYYEVYSDFAESEKGFYYVYFAAGVPGKLYYLSKDNGTIIPFCTKAECEHKLPSVVQLNDKDDTYEFECEAAVYLNQKLQVYNGKLYIDRGYVYNDELSLECWSLDGSDKKVIIRDMKARAKQIEEGLVSKGDGGFKSSLSWRIHNDSIYIIGAIQELGEYGSYFYIDEYDLNTGEFVKQLYTAELHRNNIQVSSMYISDSAMMLEVVASVPQSDKGQNFSTGYEYYKFDIEKQELKLIPLEDRYFATLMEDRVLYQKNGQDIYSVDENGVEKLCIELEDNEKTGCGVVPKYIGEYIFVTPYFDDLENTEGIQFYTKIYDKNYNLVDTVNLPKYLPVRAGHNQIIWGMSSLEVYYINTAEIGSGNIELKKYERQ